MRAGPFVGMLVVPLVSLVPSDPTMALQAQRIVAVSESRVPVGNAPLYSRAVGSGRPVIVLYGGPDFDSG